MGKFEAHIVLGFTFIVGFLAGIDGLSPKGSNVCSHECHTLEWKAVNLTRTCGHPLFVQACTITIRKPVTHKATCYECCEGWRQSDEENCLKECISGNAGISSCDGIPDGWYQLCDACDEFAKCDSGHLLRMKCPRRRRWDDYSKKCVKHSQTCEIPNEKSLFDINKIEDEMIHTNQDVYNELTNEIGFESSVASPALGCDELGCQAPGRCIMMFSYDVYQPRPKCLCPAGMRISAIDQTHCESIDECQEQSPCENGICIDRKFGFKCKCERGWRGRLCNKPRRHSKKNKREQVRHEIHWGRNNENDDDDDSWDWPKKANKNNDIQ